MNQDMLLRLVITGDGKVAVQAVEQVEGATRSLDAQQKKGVETTNQMTSAIGRLSSEIALLKGLAAGVFSIDAIMQAWDGYKRVADTVTLLDARLRLATNGTEDFRRAQTELFDLSQRMGVSYTALGGSFARIATTVRELGGSTQQAIQLSEILAATARLSGASAQEQASAAQQFAQALGSGVLQGDELRSILENNQRLSRALAEGLGVSTAQLRAMGEEGKLTADVVARAILSQSGKIQSELSSMQATFALAREQIVNEITAIIGEINQLTDTGAAAAAVAPALHTISETLRLMRQDSEDAGKALRQGPAAQDIAKNIETLADLFRDLHTFGQFLSVALEGIRHVITGVVTDVVLGAQAVATAMGGSGAAYAQFAEAVARRNGTIEESYARLQKAIDKANSAKDRFDANSEKVTQQEVALTANRGLSFTAENKRLSGLGNPLIAAAMGVEAADDRTKKALEKYAEHVMQGSAKAQKALDKVTAEIAASKAALKSALDLAVAAGDTDKAASLQARLTERIALEAKIVADGQRKVAEAKATEAKKGHGAAQAAADAHFKAMIAKEEAFQSSFSSAIKEQIAEEKHKYDNLEITATEYYNELANLQLLDLTFKQESVERELKLARERGVRGRDAAEKYEAELAIIERQKAKVVRDTNDAILAADRKFWSARVKEMQAFDEAASKYAQGTYEILAASQAVNEEKQFELSIAHLSEEAQKRAIALRKIEIERTKALTAAELEYFEMKKAARTEADFEAALSFYKTRIAAINQAKDGEAAMTVAVLEQKAALDQTKQFWDGFFQSLKGGWKGVRDYVKNFFFDWLLKQLSQQFTMNIAVGASGGGGLSGILGSLFGGGGSSSGGLGGILGSLFGGGGGSSGIVADMGIPGLGSMLGLGGAGAGGGLLGGILGGAGSIATSLGFTGIASGLASVASFIPVIGPFIALAAALLPGLLKNKDGLWFDFGSQYMGKGKGASQEFDTALGSIAIRGEGKLDDVKPFVAQMQNLAKNFVDIFGQTLADKARTALGNWTGFSNRGKGTEYENGQELAAALATESKDVMAEYFSRVFSVVDQRLADTISAWTGTTEELTKYIQGILGVQQSLTQQAPLLKAIIGETITLSQVVDLQKEGEALADTFSRILNAFSITNSIAEAMGKGADAFGEVGIKSLEARERLIAMSGGLQALTGNLTTYLEQFFTEEERAAMQRKLAQQQLDAGFSALGLSVPRSREEFRRLVTGIDLTTEAGQRLFAELIKLAPAVAAVYTAAKDARKPLKREDDPAVGRSNAYSSMFTDAENAAYKAAQAAKVLNENFAHFGLAVPRTAAEYRALAEAQDQTTYAGRETYRMLMDMADEFIDFTGVVAELRNVIAIDIVQGLGTEAAKTRLETLFAIIEAGGESMAVQLQRKSAAALTAAQEFQAQYIAALAANFGQENANSIAARTARDAALLQQSIVAGDMALLATLRAQYGDHAEAMFELEKWHQAQIAAANGNAAQLLMIEQSYGAKRNAILTGSVASGLDTLKSTLQAWLNSLLLNNQLTTLTPLQRLEEARSQYEAAITSGDAGKITSAADAYLREARDYFASGAGYNQIFAMVRAQVDALAHGNSVYVAPAPNTAPGTNGAGGAAGTAAIAAANAANVASNAADATTRAVQQSQAVLAEIMAAVKHTINDEAEAQRAADLANTAAIVSAVSVPSRIAV